MLRLDSVLEVDPFDSLSTWRFLKFPFLLTGRLSRSPRQLRPSCAYKALHVLPALLCAAPDVCRRSSAAWLPPSSSHAGALGLAVSWLQRRSDDYVEWVKHFPSLKEIWSWIRNNLRLMNSTMISYVNSFPKIQPWFHDIIHSTEFTHMNSYMISWLWIHQHEFRGEFIHMNSDIWIHDILHNHEFISEFISWIHIRFHDHEFICDISWPMNSYMNSCIWRISWNHTWIHVYQGSRWPRPRARLRRHGELLKLLRLAEWLSLINCQLEVTNVVEPGITSSSKYWI